jgi:hypothetical protein
MSKERDKYYEGYSLFNVCEDRILQAYNRIVTYWTILSDAGKVKASGYVKNFSNDEKGEIKKLLALMDQVGMHELKRRVIAGQI